MKTMNLEDFQKDGYLLWLNRTLLHPIGLALAFAINDETGIVEYVFVQDYRKDPEGISFGKEVSQELIDKVTSIREMYWTKMSLRRRTLGYSVQPLFTMLKKETKK